MSGCVSASGINRPDPNDHWFFDVVIPFVETHKSIESAFGERDEITKHIAHRPTCSPSCNTVMSVQ
jgi:hypothetical protein